VTAPPSPAALPLARLLGHAADAVAAVRAGRSLTDALARCPDVARPGTQALAFHALRWLGAAEVVRRRLAPKTPPPEVDALLLVALALLWPPGNPPYAEHLTLVDQAVAAATRRAPRAPASSTPCCGASFASARRSWPRRWPSRWRASIISRGGSIACAPTGRIAGSDRRRRQPASADDPARQRPARQRGSLRRRAGDARDRGRAPRRPGGGPGAGRRR
jgi:hypothetical protein